MPSETERKLNSHVPETRPKETEMNQDSTFCKMIIKYDIPELFNNGTHSRLCSAPIKLPDYKCQNGKIIKVFSFQELLQEVQAKVYINHDFGFEMASIKVLPNIDGFYGYYNATDYNYIRFNVKNWQYQVIDGELEFFFD